MPKQRRTEYTNKYFLGKNQDSVECKVFGGSLPESTDNLLTGKSVSSENSQLNFKILSSSSDSDVSVYKSIYLQSSKNTKMMKIPYYVKFLT